MNNICHYAEYRLIQGENGYIDIIHDIPECGMIFASLEMKDFPGSVPGQPFHTFVLLADFHRAFEHKQ